MPINQVGQLDKGTKPKDTPVDPGPVGHEAGGIVQKFKPDIGTKHPTVSEQAGNYSDSRTHVTEKSSVKMPLAPF